MDEELLAAVAEVREWAARQGGPMDHMTDAEVLEGIQQCMTSLPTATVQVAKDRGLTKLAQVLGRFVATASRRRNQ